MNLMIRKTQNFGFDFRRFYTGEIIFYLSIHHHVVMIFESSIRKLHLEAVEYPHP